MATPATMRQLEERQVDRAITDLLWSPKMDIIAVVNESNDISLFRLNWQRIWTTDSNECKCTALAWRPDGKVLAVGYENGKIEHYDVESNVPILKSQVVDGSSISFMRWSSMGNSLLNSKARKEFDDKDKNKDWDFLIQFPSLSKAFSYNPSNQEDVQNCRKLSTESDPSMLICGTVKGQVSFFMSGYLAIGSIDVNKLYNFECIIKDVILSPHSLGTISVLASPAEEQKEVINLSFTAFPLISSCFTELCTLAEKQSVLMGTIEYMADTLKQISEGWESILLEMDNKLHGYAKKMSDQHGMSADFLELLMLGTPSPELETFLFDLGEKGLKKLGHSIEVSYSNMQRLVLKYLHTVSQAINFHLAEIVGHVRASDKYESVLKFTEESIINAQTRASEFWAKGIELQQVIDESMKCFKAFFRWLYVEILRLSDESVSEEMSKASQQDVEFIAEFLNSFSKGVDDDSYTYLERVGQYMKHENLRQPVDRSKNPWYNFLKEHPDIRDLPDVLVVNEEASLMQAYDHLRNAVENAFASLNCDLTESCIPQGCVQITGIPSSKISSLQQSAASEQNDKIHGQILWTTTPLEATKAFFVEFDPSSKELRGLGLTSGSFNNTDFHMVSQSFYTSDTLSVLVTSIDGHRLIQLPISPMEPYMSKIDISPHNLTCIDTEKKEVQSMSIFSLAGPACHRELDGLNSEFFAVSGPRKVVAFLFRNKKRIRIYDMEIEEEDDDEGDTLGNSGFSSEHNTSF